MIRSLTSLTSLTATFNGICGILSPYIKNAHATWSTNFTISSFRLEFGNKKWAVFNCLSLFEWEYSLFYINKEGDTAESINKKFQYKENYLIEIRKEIVNFIGE